MTWAYRIENLHCLYGATPVLQVDQLAIETGEMVALVGPNGAGKTTLLHALAFVEPPTEGSILFFEEPAGKHNAISFRRRVGLLLQNPYLFHTTVLRNITWGLKLRGISRATAKDAALAALESVGLSGFEYRDARTLSGGETQRVALARALALDPDVLLLDEPANHMDQESIRRTEQIVQEINSIHRKTIVLTTHDLSKIQTVAHRVVHLHQGRVVPASGENLFPGELQQEGSVFQTRGITVRLPYPAIVGTLVAIDPSKIRIFPSAPVPATKNCYRGRVVSLSADNGMASIRVDAGECFHVISNMESPFIRDFRLEQDVWITVDPEGIRVL